MSDDHSRRLRDEIEKQEGVGNFSSRLMGEVGKPGTEPESSNNPMRDSDPRNRLLRGLVGAAKQIKDATVTPAEKASQVGGIDQRSIMEATPYFNAGAAEGAILADGGIKGYHNTFIIMGRDRPGAKESGNGSGPTTHCGCIDIIAGLNGVLARETTERDSPTQWTEGLAPKLAAAAKVKEQVKSNKSPELDAARIYLTQRAINIDGPEYFNLAAGKVGKKENQSACVIKADAVRLVGRNGIKLVTSGDVYSGGMGELIKHRVRGIDLIAGNNDKDMQPLVKGNDLKFVLDSKLELIEDLHSSVFYLFSLLVYFMLSMFDPTGTAASRLVAQLRSLPQEYINLFTQEMNFVIHQFNYDTDKNPFAHFNFNSRFNHTN